MRQGAESRLGIVQQELCCQGSSSEGGSQPRKSEKEPDGKKPIVTPSGLIGQLLVLNSTSQHSGATCTPSRYPEHSRCPWPHHLVPGEGEEMLQGTDNPEYGMISVLFFLHLLTYTA